jgi:hypothetical protein
VGNSLFGDDVTGFVYGLLVLEANGVDFGVFEFPDTFDGDGYAICQVDVGMHGFIDMLAGVRTEGGFVISFLYLV